MTARELELRSQLEAALAPGVVSVLLELVDERVAASTSVASPGSPWLALDEAAAYLRVSERTIERMVGRGRLRSTTIGRRRLVRRDDLDRAATGEETTPAAPPRRRG